MKFRLVAALLALSACSADASQPRDFDVVCEGVALHFNGFSAALSDASALPVQRYRISSSHKTVFRVMADRSLDNLCHSVGKCDVHIDDTRVRLSSSSENATTEFFVDRRTGFAYHILRIALKPDERDVSSWQMSCDAPVVNAPSQS